MGDGGTLNATMPGVALAWIELLDRDGTVRQAWPVTHWPLRVGRALDNEIALGDSHIAPHHFEIGPDEDGLALAVDDTVNGVHLGSKLLRRGDRARLPLDGEPIDLTAGRTRLRLRLPGQALAPEVAIAPAASLQRRVLPVFMVGLALLACVLFATYLSNDPDTFARAAGSTVLGVIVGISLWSAAWALLSKLFTRQAHFGWHFRVALFAGLALMVLDALPPLAAFAFSWPWATDYSFVPEIAVVATALYYHLLAVEPTRHRALKLSAVTCGVVGIGLTLWFNQQRSDQFGDELYMNHLFPPAFRVAKPVSTDALVNSLQPLKATLDRKAKEAGGEEGAPGEED